MIQIERMRQRTMKKRCKYLYIHLLSFIFCFLCSLYDIKKSPIFGLYMYNTQEINKLNHFSEYSTGGHMVDSLWTAEAFFEIMDISFFVIFGKNGRESVNLDF